MNKIQSLAIKASEISIRRKILAENLLKKFNIKKHLIILFSAEVQYKTQNIPRVFHQEPNFRYFSGFPQRNATLLMKVEPEKISSSLFIDCPSKEEILWNGTYPSKEEAQFVSGVDEVFYGNDLKSFFEHEVEKENFPYIWSSNFNKISSKILNNIEFRDIAVVSDIQRVIKSPAEIEIMKASAKITSDTLKLAMSYTRPDMDEHHLLGKLNYDIHKFGGQLAYPPVIAGGPRANIIHYLEGARNISDSELVLVDIGSDVHGYYSDVTRTWPVNGRFSHAQCILYDILHNIHEDCIKACIAGKSLNNMLSFMYRRMAHYFIEESIVKDKQNIQKICPHHIGHYLGLDIHDTPTISPDTPLSAGMVFPLEPGLYFPENCDFVDPMFRGIGMRLEDDFVMTTSGTVECLTPELPRSRSDIEKQCNSFRVNQ